MHSVPIFQPQAIDPLLRQSIGEFLRTLQDPDLNVRRVALVAFNSAAHNKPSLVRDLLDSVLPQLYSETKVRVGIAAFRCHIATIIQQYFLNCHKCYTFKHVCKLCVIRFKYQIPEVRLWWTETFFNTVFNTGNITVWKHYIVLALKIIHRRYTFIRTDIQICP